MCRHVTAWKEHSWCHTKEFHFDLYT